MRDDSHRVVCCQSADEELLRYQPELFDCSRCAIAEAQAGLSPENRAAWAVYHQLALRVVVDLGVGADVFGRLTADLDADDMAELVARLSVIYDVLQPPRT